jgi:hypothetical protein
VPRSWNQSFGSMARTIRQALIAALVAWHAGTTLCGPCLHALPGWGHGSGLSPREKDDHSHGPGKSDRQAGDDCPVCQFLAGGQITPGPAPGVFSRLIAEAEAPAPPSFTPSTPRSPSIPRGPPASPGLA